MSGCGVFFNDDEVFVVDDPIATTEPELPGTERQLIIAEVKEMAGGLLGPVSVKEGENHWTTEVSQFM